MTSKPRRSALGGLAGLIAAVAFALLVSSASAAPMIAIEAPSAGATTGPVPTFEGTTTDSGDPVTVLVHEGGTSSGTVVRTLQATPQQGTWTVQLPAAEALPDGTYAAEAEQSELAGGAMTGESAHTEAVTFTVDTSPPELTIVAPKSPSNDTTPAFSGTASEAGEVVVHVMEDSIEVAKATTTTSGGSWSTTSLDTSLAKGKHTYTAYATANSSLGNPPGQSNEVAFEVDTEAPKLSLSGPPAVSDDTSPSFSGTTSEDGEIVVHIFEGSSQVATATAESSGGQWSTAPTTVKGGDRHFTAYATEESGLENGEGRSATVSFEVDTEAPSVSIVGPPSPSRNTTPSFSGTASEEAEVVVHVFEGTSELASVSTMATSGTWSAALSKALPSGKHTFTAYATEKSGLENGEGRSATVSFEVDTEAPSVSIVAPPSPSRNTTPSFSGTASEDTEVVVHVFEGTSEVGSVSTTASGGTWSTSTLSKALPSGEHAFTAYATEKSGLGNAEGKSATVSFEVDTGAPSVSIVGPASPSKDTTPSFSGTASEDTEVVVHVFEGTSEVGSVSTTAAGGKWSVALSKALPSGRHAFTAYATEKSGLGNGEGKSATVSFEVDTEAPSVSIVAPASPSKDTTPSFSGTASEDTEVVVHVFEGTSEVGSVSTTASGGKWSAALSKALPSGKHTFTAYATEKSGLGNGEGKSATVSFEVDTGAPSVSIVAPASPSKDTTPSFSGTASEDTEVVVHVFEGSTEVVSGSTTASGGKWSAALSKALPSGKHAFTAYATEKSGLGNAEGKSATVAFEVDTEGPSVSIVAPASPSKDTTPSFSGTASEAGEVVVHVLEGGKQIVTVSGSVREGKWSATLTSPLPSGRHAFTAYATEESGLENGEGRSATVSFEVDTEAPSVSIVGPSSPSKDTTPSFSGTASEDTEVVVHVFEGSTEVASGSTTASGGKWSAALSKALPSGKHAFTAYATEKSGLGNGEGKSATVSFEVDTEAPSVSIVGPSSPSKDTTPSFSGTASEDTEVVVHVFEGTSELASVSTTAAGGKWSAALSKALPSGKHAFTAYATEKSGLGNGEGKSATVSFEVDTEAPSVSIVRPSSPSRNTSPSFSGTASEETEVVVHVFEGSTEVASGSTTASGGKWSAALSKALPSGKRTFTAYATEKSGLGNAEGKSATVSFEVDTEPPSVSIVAPASPSKHTTPAFSGTASEDTEVVVHIFEGTTEAASVATTASGGKWSAALSKALPSGKHAFTAYATEKSGLGNAEGKSATVAFEVDTEPPSVSIVGPPSPSKHTTPAFSGTASEETEVVVHIFEGTTEAASVATTASGGKWSAALSKALPSGKHAFTAYATEKSGLGNAEGKSATVAFEVDTEPPSVSIVAPASPSKDTTPAFSGTASEETEVVVHVFEGSTEVASGSTTASGGKWSAALSKALPSGKHTFTAYATEKSGLENAEGKSATVSFEVDTEPPTVSIVAPPSPANDTTPAFSGAASEDTEVVVHIFEGTTEAASVATTAAGGKWSAALSKALPSGKHAFTAYATEKSGLENAEGKSATVSFEVNTNPPVVTLESPPLVSPDQNPSFSGSASESLQVTVEVFKGATAQGTAVAKIVATVTAGRYKSSDITTTLPTGQYTAIATEPSSIGNEPGHSAPVTWEVDTEVPLVEITPPTSPSNNTEPTFSGTVSGPSTETVTVNVYEGVHERPEGRDVVELAAHLSKGVWKTGAVTPALPSGRHSYTLFASAQSSIGNGTGVSAPRALVVDTEPATVTLAQPATPSNDATPAFHGTASETTQVEVAVYSGPSASGVPVATVSVPGTGGAWESPRVAALEDGQYTAVATQKSAIGNGPGASAPVTFTIDTKAPTVTLDGLPSPSSDRKPDFSGAASDSTSVTVSIYRGAVASGTPVVSIQAEVSEGEWNTGPLPEALELEFGLYTAVASEPSSLGNATGASAPVTFAVEDIPPGVTTEGSAAVSRTYATLYAGVDPVGGSVSACNIEVGTSTAYGRSIGCGFVSGALSFPPEATGFVPVFSRVYFLTAGTTYHYRVVATGEGGTASGADMTFTTLPPLPKGETTPPPAPAAVGLGESEVRAFFAEELGPHGSAARIGTILRKGLYAQTMKAPEAGTATVGWYYQPPAAKHGKKKPAPVLVATGRVTFSAAGSKTLTLRLTKAGRTLLKRSRQLKITVRCSFQSVGGTAVTSSGTFRLHR